MPFDPSALAAAGLIHPSWEAALRPVASDLESVAQFLAAEVANGNAYLPAEELVLRAFSTALESVRVLIVGQDPYPTPGHPIGLSFAVDPRVRPLPRSLSNIYRELADDLGITPPAHGDLTPWTRQGVMLLNRVLTVGAGLAGSHRGIGWEAVTEHAIKTLVSRGTPLVAVLWGRDAARLLPILGETPVIISAHPSPLSASRGFFGSRPFSRVNELLREQGSPAIDWSLESSQDRHTDDSGLATGPPPLF